MNVFMIGCFFISTIFAKYEEEYPKLSQSGPKYVLHTTPPLPSFEIATLKRHPRNNNADSYGYDLFMPTGITEVIQSFLSKHAEIAVKVISTLQENQSRLLPAFLKTFLGFIVYHLGIILGSLTGLASTQIDKLMFWQVGGWMKYEAKPSNLILHLTCDQLIITSGIKILESFNMNSKIKGIYKGDVLILIIGNSGQETRKIKFQILTDVTSWLRTLADRFPMSEHNSRQQSNVALPRFRNMKEVLKCVVENIEKKESVSMTLPSNFNSFIKLCLLDPAFPSFVKETQNMLQTEIEK